MFYYYFEIILLLFWYVEVWSQLYLDSYPVFIIFNWDFNS